MLCDGLRLVIILQVARILFSMEFILNTSALLFVYEI